MCGIVDSRETLDINKLAKDLEQELPPYARPIFLRIMTSLEMTSKYPKYFFLLYRQMISIRLMMINEK